MARMPHLAQQGKRSKKSKMSGKPDVVNREDYEAMERDSRLELIRSLIPLGLIAVYEELEREVDNLAGARHSRKLEGRKHYRIRTVINTVHSLGIGVRRVWPETISGVGHDRENTGMSGILCL